MSEVHTVTCRPIARR